LIKTKEIATFLKKLSNERMTKLKKYSFLIVLPFVFVLYQNFSIHKSKNFLLSLQTDINGFSDNYCGTLSKPSIVYIDSAKTRDVKNFYLTSRYQHSYDHSIASAPKGEWIAKPLICGAAANSLSLLKKDMEYCSNREHFSRVDNLWSTMPDQNQQSNFWYSKIKILPGLIYHIQLINSENHKQVATCVFKTKSHFGDRVSTHLLPPTLQMALNADKD
jgi:hypothetical protein